jgi:hypothetical protein
MRMLQVIRPCLTPSRSLFVKITGEVYSAGVVSGTAVGNRPRLPDTKHGTPGMGLELLRDEPEDRRLARPPIKRATVPVLLHPHRGLSSPSCPGDFLLALLPNALSYFSFAYSALAVIRTGISGSASFHSRKKS